MVAVTIEASSRIGDLAAAWLAMYEGAESPAERRMVEHIWQAACLVAVQARVTITPQAQLGPYRVDWLVQVNELAVVIEVDGAAYHTGPEAVARDRARDAANLLRGYKTIRFTAANVTKAGSPLFGVLLALFGRMAMGQEGAA